MKLIMEHFPKGVEYITQFYWSLNRINFRLLWGDSNKIAFFFGENLMGEHRMFSNRIANSARFLQMPAESQLLYFHFILRADDDGVVESYPIMKLLGLPTDNYKILLAKGYIKELNEDQVIVITDWLEHNTIRADRKVNSIYLPMLQEKYPELPIIEPKPRSDVKDNSKRLNGQSTDRRSKVKLSKDKLSKVNLDQGNIIYECEYFKVFEKRHNNYRELHPTLNLIEKYKEARQWLIDNDKTMKRWTYITNWLKNSYKYNNYEITKEEINEYPGAIVRKKNIDVAL
jgi:hypothetical protein